MTMYHLPRRLIDETFSLLRGCGRGRHECQVLWLSSWDSPELLAEVVHPRHRAHLDGFVLDDKWLSDFWLSLANRNMGVRVQVHTHPQEAFHSLTDDRYPIVHTPGFLSLVIPNFALGPVGFELAYLTKISPNGAWKQVSIDQEFKVK